MDQNQPAPKLRKTNKTPAEETGGGKGEAQPEFGLDQPQISEQQQREARMEKTKKLWKKENEVLVSLLKWLDEKKTAQWATYLMKEVDFERLKKCNLIPKENDAVPAFPTIPYPWANVKELLLDYQFRIENTTQVGLSLRLKGCLKQLKNNSAGKAWENDLKILEEEKEEQEREGEEEEQGREGEEAESEEFSFGFSFLPRYFEQKSQTASEKNTVASYLFLRLLDESSSSLGGSASSECR